MLLPELCDASCVTWALAVLILAMAAAKWHAPKSVRHKLRIHLRIRFGLGPYKDSFWSGTVKERPKSNGFVDSVLKSIKKHWFYSIRPKKSSKKAVVL